MTIHERAVVALARARAAGVPAPLVDTAHQRRLRAAMTRDVATLLGVAPEHVVVTDDPDRSYGSMPGQLIIVRDPDDPGVLLRFIPEPGNTGTGGGAYLLLAACPGCSEPDTVREVPTLSVAGLADLGHTAPALPTGGGLVPDLDQLPIEFFDDPQHTGLPAPMTTRRRRTRRAGSSPLQNRPDRCLEVRAAAALGRVARDRARVESWVRRPPRAVAR